MGFLEEDFKNCMGCFASGVTVVSVLDDDGNPHGLTVSSFTSLSLSPPLVTFNIDKLCYNYQLLSKAEHFTVNILHEDQIEISRQFASTYKKKFKNIKYILGETKTPILEGVIAYIECESEHIYDGGDHSIFVGRVVNLNNEEGGQPLLYYKGKYSKISEVGS